MPDPCRLCDGSGMCLIERPDGSRAAKECDCRAQRRQVRQLAAARIPDRYIHCTLDDYEPGFARANDSLSKALVMARSFVRSYPLETAGNGLLLTGSIGVGKTHLAIGILRALMQERGALGLFYDYCDLLKQIQNSYNRSVGATEMEILRPVFEAEVLVLNELGAGKPTEWVWKTVAHVLNTRYNDRRTTILTTNYANLPLAGLDTQSQVAVIRAASREETLGDPDRGTYAFPPAGDVRPRRIIGTDFRQRVRRAAYASWGPDLIPLQRMDRARQSLFAEARACRPVRRERSGLRQKIIVLPDTDMLHAQPVDELSAIAQSLQSSSDNLPHSTNACEDCVALHKSCMRSNFLLDRSNKAPYCRLTKYPAVRNDTVVRRTLSCVKF